MRRSNREVVGLTNMLSILNKCNIMRIGLCVDNEPYIVPLNFAYEVIDEEVFIYFHCASKGKKLDMIAQNSNACFEADCSYKTMEAENACDWSAEFESVIGNGKITILKDEAQKVRVLDTLMKRYGFPGKPYYIPSALAAVTVLQIRVTSMTGKRKMNPDTQ